MALCQLGFPVFIRPRIAPAHNAVHLFVGPGVEIYGFDTADVNAHASVNT